MAMQGNELDWELEWIVVESHWNREQMVCCWPLIKAAIDSCQIVPPPSNQQHFICKPLLVFLLIISISICLWPLFGWCVSVETNQIWIWLQPCRQLSKEVHLNLARCWGMTYECSTNTVKKLGFPTFPQVRWILPTRWLIWCVKRLLFISR